MEEFMILHFESRLNSPQYKLRFEDWLMLSCVGKESYGCRPLLSFIGGQRLQLQIKIIIKLSLRLGCDFRYWLQIIFKAN